MKISKWKVVWSFVTGGGTGVVDYLLGLLKQVLVNLGAPTKEKIQAVLNFTVKILSVLKAVQIFIPVKWQVAYLLTLRMVEQIVGSLQDLEITGAELKAIVDGYDKAYAAWMSPDDETCVDLVEGPDGTFAARSYGA